MENTLQKIFNIIITDLHAFVKYVIIRTVFAVFADSKLQNRKRAVFYAD